MNKVLQNNLNEKLKEIYERANKEASDNWDDHKVFYADVVNCTEDVIEVDLLLGKYDAKGYRIEFNLTNNTYKVKYGKETPLVEEIVQYFIYPAIFG